MPLIKSKSNKARSQNIGELIASGKRPDVAAAIAYKVQRKAGGHPKRRGFGVGDKRPASKS